MHELDKYGNNAMHLAAKHGRYQMCEYLIYELLNLNRQNLDEWKPLHLTAANNHSKILS